MSANDGGPAFPSKEGAYTMAHKGMSLRDWLAGQALGHLPVLARTTTTIGPGREGATEEYTEVRNPAEVAAQAYKIADAMLAERGET